MRCNAIIILRVRISSSSPSMPLTLCGRRGRVLHVIIAAKVKYLNAPRAKRELNKETTIAGGFKEYISFYSILLSCLSV